MIRYCSMRDVSTGAMPEASLAAMQRGMLGKILGSPIPDTMPPIGYSGAGPTPDERLAVYIRGYAERLRECLAADFPALRGFVGEQVFDLFARGYLARCPSRSRSLYDLGSGFAAYLGESIPLDDADPLDNLPSDLARLERAQTEAHRAHGPEEAGPVDPAFFLIAPRARVFAPETLRLVRSDFALKDVLDAINLGEWAAIPPARPTFYAVARANYRVGIHELSAAQFAFVEACSAGHDLLSALDAAGAEGASRADMLAWLPQAIAAGFVMTNA